MTQIQFDNREPLARNTDVETSHLAAKTITTTGTRGTAKRRIYNWLIENGVVTKETAITPHELAARSGIGHPSCHKRLPDLRRDGLVVTVTARVCQVTGRRAFAWRACTAAAEEMRKQ